MSRHPLYAAGFGLALFGVLLYFAENAALLIAAAPIALSFGWNIFNMLEAKADKRRGETGRDTIDNSGGAGGGDTILYGAGVRHDDLWFAQDGRDLRITAFFGGNSQVTVQNWFSDPDAQVDRIETAEGHTLDRSKVDALISAMAAMAPPASGQTYLSEQQKTALAPTLAAAWQAG